jgi:hypothetical protein
MEYFFRNIKETSQSHYATAHRIAADLITVHPIAAHQADAYKQRTWAFGSTVTHHNDRRPAIFRESGLNVGVLRAVFSRFCRRRTGRHWRRAQKRPGDDGESDAPAHGVAPCQGLSKSSCGTGCETLPMAVPQESALELLPGRSGRNRDPAGSRHFPARPERSQRQAANAAATTLPRPQEIRAGGGDRAVRPAAAIRRLRPAAARPPHSG